MTDVSVPSRPDLSSGGRLAHYEAVFGRSLDDHELGRLDRARALLELRVPARVRRRAARLVATL